MSFKLEFLIHTDANDDPIRWNMKICERNKRFPDGSFVAEALTTNVDCHQTDLPDLGPFKCMGNVRLRDFDKRQDA